MVALSEPTATVDALKTLPLTLKAQLAVECVDLEQATGVEDARWELFQIGFLNNTTRFGLDIKARQIAWSFTAALDAVLDGILHPDTPHIFISVNQEEAAEKVRYARMILSAMDLQIRPKLTHETGLSLEFVNGSRLISHPCRPVRGKARARVYLDEIAHYGTRLDREVFTGALPATTRGDGYIRMGSSPLGRRGIFWEIATETFKTYPGFRPWKRILPWWTIRSMTSDLHAVETDVEQLPTSERVYRYGSTVLIEIFENMILEDFQQEYECEFGVEAEAWIPWELIQENQDPDLWFRRARSVEEARVLVGEFLEAIKSGKIESAFCGGIDIGRKHDKTELCLTGLDENMLPVRALISLSNIRFDDQEELFVEIIEALPIVAVLVDQTGIGWHLAENLGKRTGKAIGMTFTVPSKELWAVDARLALQRKQTLLPLDREFAYQVHSVRRKVSPAGHELFDVEASDSHHADQFWAWALALQAGGKIEKAKSEPVVQIVDTAEYVQGLPVYWGCAAGENEHAFLLGQVREEILYVFEEIVESDILFKKSIKTAEEKYGDVELAYVDSKSAALRVALTDAYVTNALADTKASSIQILKAAIQQLSAEGRLVIHNRCEQLRRSLLRQNLIESESDLVWTALHCLVRAAE